MAETITEPRGRDAAESDQAEPPDLSVLNLCRRSPPRLDLAIFGPAWAEWIEGAANAAACPPDYVVAPLLSAAGTLIGNARWAHATPGWIEPAHLWCASVGDSGSGKSPGGDIFYRHILPPLERRLAMDFPDLVEDYRIRRELAEARKAAWRLLARQTEKKGLEVPHRQTSKKSLRPSDPGSS